MVALKATTRNPQPAARNPQRYHRGVTIVADHERRDQHDERFSATVAAVTSAFGDPTRREIFLYVRATPDATASQVASAFSLHPNVARHHLDRLAAGGYLQVSLRPPDGAVTGTVAAGRPAKRYRVTAEHDAAAHPELVGRGDELLVSLLAEAVTRLGAAEAEELAEAVGERFGRHLASKMQPGDSSRSVQAAMHAVADALTAHGFAAHAERRGGASGVVAEHCPFGELSTDHPALCAVDRGLVRGMLAGLCGDDCGGVPVTLSSRARGDDSCAAWA